MNKHFHNELSNFQMKYEKLLIMSYNNFKKHIQNLEQQLQCKDKLIKQLLETIQNIIFKHDSPNILINNNRYTIQKNYARQPNSEISTNIITQDTTTTTEDIIMKNISQETPSPDKIEN